LHTIRITPAPITLNSLAEVLRPGARIDISPESLAATAHCRIRLDDMIAKSAAPIYGINTGFGSLCDTAIAPDQLEQLQENLVLSHACGMGDEVERDIVRLMLFLKIKGLSLGHSGVQTVTLERLALFFNEDLMPVVYAQGSLGASGDLAPLAHLSLPLLGRGEVIFKGTRMAASEALAKLGVAPIRLQSKEGLALLNGTQFMSAHAAYIILKAHRLSDTADMVAAMALDAYDGRIEPFTPQIHHIRPHQGQITVAARMRSLLQGSQLATRPKTHVQDPYSFRCIPQVHGASRDALAYATKVIETEINAVTDNPTVFPEDDLVVSAGNFHGQPLALMLDFLAIALAEWGSISERRTYKLISGTRGLPAFLVKNPGLNSGFMIPQYAAASMVSQNKQLCSPASVDTIDSSNGQEDHVSMGANAATKCLQVLRNAQQIIGIELLTAAQALELRGPELTSPIVSDMFRNFRAVAPFADKDTYMHPLMMAAFDFVKNHHTGAIEGS